MRPLSIQDYVGQEHLLGKNKPLRLVLETGNLHSLILWGPPGSGKTTLARLLANSTDYELINLSVVMSGVKDIRSSVKQAQDNRQNAGKNTLIFVDEVHRFNKSQQDAFLPYVEDGTFVFVGATTENPSFELNNALLSRTRVYLLKTLSDDSLMQLINRSQEKMSAGPGAPIVLPDKIKNQIIFHADGDARRLYNVLDLMFEQAMVFNEQDQCFYPDEELVAYLMNHSPKRYDKGGDIYYDQISAFHKSVRGSSPDGALYWMSRMIEAGCDPLYIARRLLAIASEDIGNADPKAMTIALNAWDAFHRLGPAEGNRAIAQAAVYCAVAPKSNAVYMAFKAATEAAKNSPSFEVPHHLRNAPTALLKEQGYGAEYRYSHDEEEAFSAGQTYLPEELGELKFYHPVERGLEIKIKQKLDYLKHKNSIKS
ncbi:MAG: replication-associated recombination protein A [Gammaproteobacteria bacterium]|nr:replication-associated recombination protein A [Gammaproteobacteria bacterium]